MKRSGQKTERKGNGELVNELMECRAGWMPSGRGVVESRPTRRRRRSNKIKRWMEEEEDDA
jgi:predicted YcjX-like family ATPase